MEKICKKGLVLMCVAVILMAPFISACGKKAPPKPPTEKSGEQIHKKLKVPKVN
jgi:predicted small lipoprotein YifL